MKPYSIELREKIVKIYEQGDTSIRKVAARFDMSEGFVQKILKQKQTTGHVQPQQHRGSLKSVLNSRTNEVVQMVEKYPDTTLSEYCEYWRLIYNEAVSPSMRWIELQKQNLTRKNRPYAVLSLLLKECKFSGVNIGKK
jgi:transposase